MRLAFVDLETTGGSPVEDRITEVGIIEVDLDEVDRRAPPRPIREWSALVNPDAPIPPFIETLTGITNAMVADAPRFEELAADILTRLDGRLFIAHNARFDHGFLKNAFRRLGHPFRPSVLCTVRLSRKLYPGYSRHNLDTLIERHRLSVDMRHRALGDARLLWQLWQRFHDALPVDQITQAIDQLTARPSLPRHLDPDVLDTLPKTAGVYLFLGEPLGDDVQPRQAPNGGPPGQAPGQAPGDSQGESDCELHPEPYRESQPGLHHAPSAGPHPASPADPHRPYAEARPALRSATTDACVHRDRSAVAPTVVAEPRPLYIGKAKNLRQRVMAHFTGDHLSAREMEISQQMTRIEWIETGGGTQHDLGALLTEATLVKRLMPAYNRQLRKSDDVCAWRLVVDRDVIDRDHARRREVAVDGVDAARCPREDPGIVHPQRGDGPEGQAGDARDDPYRPENEVFPEPRLPEDLAAGPATDLFERFRIDEAGADQDVPPHRHDGDRGRYASPACPVPVARRLAPEPHAGKTGKPGKPRGRPGWKLALARPDDLFFAQDPDLYGPFATPRQAGVTLRAIADAHGLCPTLLKLDRTLPGKPCFAHQVKRCRGACIGLETVAEHTMRLKDALASLAIVPWPFEGPVAFREGDRWHVLDGWAYLGMADDFDGTRRLAVAQRRFDHDVYRLTVRRIHTLDVVELDR